MSELEELSEDELISDIMMRLKDDNTVRVQQSNAVQNNPLFLYEVLESAEVEIGDGIDLNDLSQEELVIVNSPAEQSQDDENMEKDDTNDSDLVYSDNDLMDYSNNKEKHANRNDNVNRPSSNINVNNTVNNTNTNNDNVNNLTKEEFLIVKNIPEQPQQENVEEDDPDDPDFVLSVNDLMDYSSNISDMDVASNINNNNENLHNVESDHEENISDEGGEEDLEEVKRKRNKKAIPDTWEVNRNKFLRMTGKKYVGFNRKKIGDKFVIKKSDERQERKLSPPCNSKVCKANKKRHCTEFSEEDRTKIFNEFWKFTWKEKEIYVRSQVSRTKPKRRTVIPAEGNKRNITSRRLGTLYYTLKHEGVAKVVCKTFFLNTIGIKEWMALNWVKKNSVDRAEEEEEAKESGDEEENDTSSKDHNDVHYKRKLTPKIKAIHEWLDQLPKVPSHYCRNSSSKLYLEPIWESKRKMYEEFKKEMITQVKPVGSLTMFLTIFENKNLSIYTPKKDQCDTCSAYRVGNLSDEAYQKHIAEKNRAREEKEKDKKLAITEDIYCLTADMESVKLSPMTKASAMYYKTKLCSHNYTVYNLANRHTTCYWFNECEGDLSANTFASCLIDYLEKHCTTPQRPIVIYSDGCTNQNRNQILSNALLHFSVQKNIEITQKYLIKGHTQMEGDFVHAKIEQKLKGKEVYIPYEYVKYTKEARETPYPYNAVYLSYDFFKDYTTIQYYDSIRPGKVKGDPVVVDIHCLKYETCGTIQYKLNFDDQYKLLPRRPTKPKQTVPTKLFKRRIPLPESKWKHLQELKSVNPQDYHEFYDKLPYLTGKK